MEMMPVSAALLVKVALEAAGPGEALWERFRGIIERSGSRSDGHPTQIDAAALEAIAQMPLDSARAIALINNLAAQADGNEQLLADLKGWADQAIHFQPSNRLEVLSSSIKRSYREAPSGFRTEAHFVIYGEPVG
ncbi:hypothetical protein [Streptomyces tauricus]|uniref:hypothetical protein n=1 Tax=Streptomyces tauricus TaxID=68274 RepID=UPI0033AA0EAD